MSAYVDASTQLSSASDVQSWDPISSIPAIANDVTSGVTVTVEVVLDDGGGGLGAGAIAGIVIAVLVICACAVAGVAFMMMKKKKAVYVAEANVKSVTNTPK